MTDDVAVPRSSEAVDDRTPITASRIDVAARIGWLLRTHRSVAGVSLRQMSVALREHGVSLSAASLSRVESEGQRSPAALEGYARVLGLPHGSLSAPVNLLARTFPYAPDLAPRAAPRTLATVSEAFEAIDVPSPTGGAWLEFARQHAGGIGLPRTLMEPQVRRLAHELVRSTDLVARFTRMEALSTLRCSEYADLVDSVLRGMILAPDAQNSWDLITVLAERPTPALLAWLGSLLRHDSAYLARGATYGLQGMLLLGGLPLEEWVGLLAQIEQAWLETTDSARRAVLAQLWAALPDPVRARARQEVHHECPAPGPTVWTRDRQNQHYVLAETLARAVTSRMQHPEEPLLARLLFEAMFDPRGVRMSNATYMLAFSPFAASLVHVLLEQRERLPDAGTRAAALRTASFSHAGEAPPGLEPLLASDDQVELQHVLTFYSRGTGPVPQVTLDRGLRGDEITVRRTLYCLGLTADPRLAAIAVDPTLPASTRGGARWWLEQGPRVLV